MATQSAGKKNSGKKNTPEQKQKKPGTIGAKSQQKTGKKGSPKKGKNAI